METEISKRVVHLLKEFGIQRTCVIAVAYSRVLLENSKMSRYNFWCLSQLLDMFVIHLFLRMTGIMICAMNLQLDN